MSKYKNFIFDLYGTLVDIRSDEKKMYLWEKMALFYTMQGAPYDKKELKKDFFAEDLRLRKLKLDKTPYPEIQIEDVFRRMYLNKGVTPSEALIKHTAVMFRVISVSRLKLYDGVEELLDTLHKQGRQVYLLSNAQSCFTRPEIEALGLVPYFDGILISSDEGVMKPDPAFWQVLCDRYHLDKSQCLMVGNDKTSDISGAAAAGIDSVYLESAISPKEDIHLNSTAICNLPIDKITEISNL